MIYEQHIKIWKNAPGIKYGKLYIDKPRKKRAEKAAKTKKTSTEIAIVATFLGNALVRKRLTTIWLYKDDQNSKFCRQDTETVGHIIADCDALTQNRLKLLGKSFIESHTELVWKIIYIEPSNN